MLWASNIEEYMRILVTGAKGFVGKNLVCSLNNIKDGKDRTHPELNIEEIYEFDIDTDTYHCLMDIARRRILFLILRA